MKQLTQHPACKDPQDMLVKQGADCRLVPRLLHVTNGVARTSIRRQQLCINVSAGLAVCSTAPQGT